MDNISDNGLQQTFHAGVKMAVGAIHPTEVDKIDSPSTLRLVYEEQMNIGRCPVMYGRLSNK